MYAIDPPRSAGGAPNPFALTPPPAAPAGGTPGTSDAVGPGWWNPPPASAAGGTNDGYLGPLQNLLGTLGKAVSGLFGEIGSLLDATPFSSALLSSVGDPHLGLQGTEVAPDGSSPTPVSTRYDDMASQPDLFSIDAFGNGFTVATTVSAPNAAGVTTNQSASAAMNGGDAVTLDADGTLSVTSAGRAVALAPGTSTTLSGGAVVADGTNGSVTIEENNGWGGSLATTFQANGTGVDVTATANGIGLNGSLVNQADAGLSG